MTVPQVVSAKGGKFRPHYLNALGKPFLSADGFQGMLECGHGAGFRQRLGGLRKLIRALRGKS
jgi:hypothetical protein